VRLIKSSTLEQTTSITDERAIGQLAGLRYRHNARGQVEIERKDEALKRGVKSPDRAEAVMLAFATPVVSQMLFPDEVSDRTGVAEPREDTHLDQIRQAMPEMFSEPLEPGEEPLTCGMCTAFARKGSRGLCTLRQFYVDAQMLACAFVDPVPFDGNHT